MIVSIVIPCRNEVANIEECVRAIYACDIPESSEIKVFVVDGMSDDGTREKVSELSTEFASLELIDNEQKLTPFAFNLGIKAFPGADYIQIIGARHIVSPNYLSRSLEILQEKEDVWCVGGRIINEYSNPTSELISKAMGSSFGMGIGNFRTLDRSGYTDTVTSPMYPKKVFEEVGYFDEELIRNQDDDFNYRVEQAGGKIWYEHDISLRYYVRANYKGLWRQFFQYGYWKVYVNKKHGAVTTMRQLVPPIFVFYLFSLIFTPFVGWLLGSLYGIPLILYLILNVFTSAAQSRNMDDFVNLMRTYWILHLSYGLGYLGGMWDFLLI
jgi:GT2 family glycosyltransferase